MRYDDGITYLSSGDVMAQLNYKTDLTVKSVLEYLEIDDDAADAFTTADDHTSDLEFDRHIQKSDERLEPLGLAIEIENELCRTFRTPRGLLLLPDKYLDIFTGKYSEYYLRDNSVLLVQHNYIIGAVTPLTHDTSKTYSLLSVAATAAGTADNNGFNSNGAHRFSLYD